MTFDSFMRYLGLSDVAKLFKGSFSSKTRVQRDAVSGFDHLIGDYSREVDLPVTRNGRLFYKRVSVAKLGLLNADDLNRAEQDITRILADLVRADVFSYRKDWTALPSSPTAWPFRGRPTPETMLHDSRLIDPLRFFETPPRVQGVTMSGHTCQFKPAKFPARWPRPVRVKPLYATPKLITNREAFPDDLLVETAGRLADACARYIRASNCNLRRHPLALCLGNPPEYPGDIYGPYTGPLMQQVNRLRARWGENFRYYWIRNHHRFIQLPPSGADPASSTFVINDTTPVRQGLAQRMKVGAGEAVYGDHEHTTWADPTMEFARLVQLASTLVELGDSANGAQAKLVHLHATCLADVTMRRMGYSQLQVSQGSNLYTYINALDREEQIRKRKRDENALRVLGMGGVSNGGDDEVSGGSCGTLELALQVAGPVGAVVAVVVLGVVALVAWLTTDTNVPRPETYTLHDADGNCIPALSARDAVLEGPTVTEALPDDR